jgi:Ca2+-binding RTX toxin-like protein
MANIFGTSGSDFIVAKEIGELIQARAGNDRVYGNIGNDTLYGESGDDYLAGGIGNDKLIGGDGNDGLDGGPGDDALNGGIGNDRDLNGGDGNDALLGWTGNDLLLGGNGDDLLIAGTTGTRTAEVDELLGGTGNDRFYLGMPTNKTVPAGVFYRNGSGTLGTDSYAVIKDFEVGWDKIGLYGPTQGMRSQYRFKLTDGFGSVSTKDLEVLYGTDRIAVLQDVTSISSRNITWLS